MSSIIRKDGGGILDAPVVISQALNRLNGIFAIPYGGSETIDGIFAILIFLTAQNKYLTLNFYDGFMTITPELVETSNTEIITNALNIGGLPAVPVTNMDEESHFSRTNTGILTSDYLGTVQYTMTVTEGWLA